MAALREPAAPAVSGVAATLVDAAATPGKPAPVAWEAAGAMGAAVPPGKPARAAAAAVPPGKAARVAVGAAATPGKPVSAFKSVLVEQVEKRDRWQVAAAGRA